MLSHQRFFKARTIYDRKADEKSSSLRDNQENRRSGSYKWQSKRKNQKVKKYNERKRKVEVCIFMLLASC